MDLVQKCPWEKPWELWPIDCQKVIKHVKGVYFVGYCLSAHPVTIAHTAAENSPLGEPTAKILASLANPGFKSTGGLHLKEKVPPILQDETLSDEIFLKTMSFVVRLCTPFDMLYNCFSDALNKG